jgi:hypothetical protein
MDIYRPVSTVTIANVQVDYREMGDCQIGLFWQAFIEAQRSLLSKNENYSDNEIIDIVVKTLIAKDEKKKQTLAAIAFMRPQAYQYVHQLFYEAFPSLKNISDLTSEFQGELLGHLLTVIAMRMAKEADKLLGVKNEIPIPTNS